jgi:hypothetical protein
MVHLIRKGLALAVNPDGFGEWLVRELRNLITAVAEAISSSTPSRLG